jgi:hypothetical protein
MPKTQMRAAHSGKTAQFFLPEKVVNLFLAKFPPSLSAPVFTAGP